MCISNEIPGDTCAAGPCCENTAPRGGNKILGCPSGDRKIEAEITISINCYAIYHLMLNDKIILTKT